MKKCNKCGCELIPDKNWYHGGEEGYFYICIECSKRYSNERYAKYKDTTIKQYQLANKEKIKAYNKQYMSKNKKRYNADKEELRNWFRIFKESQGCAICGYNKCGDALVYHHIKPKKKIKHITSQGLFYGHSEMYNELSKCMLLCANCHREIHYLERCTKKHREAF